MQGTHAYMVTYEGAKKLLALCPKATYHVDLDVSCTVCIPETTVSSTFRNAAGM